MTVRPNGVVRIQLTRWPILNVVSGQFANATQFPPTWTAIPGNMFYPETTAPGILGSVAPGASGAGSSALLMAPGYIDFFNGRNGYNLQVTYTNGWPHCGLTANAAPATPTQTISVDDITGWVGVAGMIYDGQYTESITCTAITPSVSGAIAGPGTLSLANELNYSHTLPGPIGDPLSTLVVSSLPAVVFQAGILIASAYTMLRGATAIAVHSIGTSPNMGGGGTGSGPHDELLQEAEIILEPYIRVL